MLVNAKQFCKETGFPVAYIRRLCRLGILPYWKCGRMYMLDRERTLAKLETLKERVPAAPYMQPLPRCRKSSSPAPMEQTVPGETGSERLKNLIELRFPKKRKAGTICD